jgi:hypothetical protein
MKVRHVPLPEESSPDAWLTAGAIYTVLAVHADALDIRYRLITENELTTPAFHSAKLFEIVNDHIPHTWVINVGIDRSGASFLELAPAPWVAAGFWEKYFDGDPDARDTFDREREKILATTRQKD